MTHSGKRGWLLVVKVLAFGMGIVSAVSILGILGFLIYVLTTQP
ncbi:hypothetical protein [Aureibacillus halotolerans]|uniref:Uncharacterized protein n=1 Tax=Aureibacillus halotolerans TaxID=1508390 RepID=A0A4R6TZC3_9BACI|nr:hypothetical protein [Aureibacillus halotolerans]TDQ37419.1 hypothetical protein EV213_11353 [Aureibacillus halotolerans]